MKLRHAWIALAALLATVALGQTGNFAVFRAAFPPGTPPVVVPPAQALSSPWLQTDIGTVTAGDAYDAAGILNVVGGGDINNDVDSGHQVYQTQTGDYQVETCVSAIAGSSVYKAAGPSVRDDGPTEDSAYCWMRFDGAPHARFQYKPLSTDFFDNYVEGPTITYPYCARIVYSGGTCSGYIGPSMGATTTLIGSSAIAFTGTRFYGVTASAGGTAEGLATATMTMPVLSVVAGNPGTVQFSVSTQTQGEQTTPLVLSVTRSGGTSGAASVQITNAGTGSAVAGTDFTNVFPATLNWSSGDGATKTQNVTLIDRTGVQSSRTLNLTLASVTGASLGSQTTQAVTITDNDGTGIKFHPGFYPWFHPQVPGQYGGYWQDVTAVQTKNLTWVANGVCPNPNIKGIRLLTSWKSFEGHTKGSYAAGMAYAHQLGDALWACSSGHKYLLIGIASTYFGDVPSLTTIYPAYLVQTAYGGTDSANNYGITYGTAGSFGIYARIWQTNTMNAYRDMMVALAADLDDEVWFEGFELGFESSLNVIPGTDGMSYSALVAQIQTVTPVIRAAAPRSALGLPANYIDSDQHMIDLHVAMAASKVGIGGPDTIVEEDIQANRTYVGEIGGVDYRNIIPFFSEIESPELCGGKDSGYMHGTYGYTYSQFYNHMFNGNPGLGIADVDPSYIIYYVMAGECSVQENQNWGALPDSWVDYNGGGALDFIQTNPAVKTTCPSSYPGCTTSP